MSGWGATAPSASRGRVGSACRRAAGWTYKLECGLVASKPNKVLGSCGVGPGEARGAGKELFAELEEAVEQCLWWGM